MAIKKKGNVDFLKDVSPVSLSSESTNIQEGTTATNSSNVSSKESENASEDAPVKRKKSLDNWGRPRKQLIEGVKEVSITVQLPETIIKALRKEGKKQGKSMKELIGTSLLSTYADLLK